MRCKHFERRQLAQKASPSHIDFFERAFLALLPAAMRAQNWKYGEVRINSEDRRIWMARQWAAQATIAHFQIESVFAYRDIPDAAEPVKAED